MRLTAFVSKLILAQFPDLLESRNSANRFIGVGLSTLNTVPIVMRWFRSSDMGSFTNIIVILVGLDIPVVASAATSLAPSTSGIHSSPLTKQPKVPAPFCVIGTNRLSASRSVSLRRGWRSSSAQAIKNKTVARRRGSSRRIGGYYLQLSAHAVLRKQGKPLAYGESRQTRPECLDATRLRVQQIRTDSGARVTLPDNKPRLVQYTGYHIAVARCQNPKVNGSP